MPIRLRRRAKRLALGVLALLAGTGGWAAESLSGRIFLGPGLALFLERDESLFVAMLRSLSLVSGETETVDLTAMMISRNQLFLGADRSVYLRDPGQGTLHPVGRWLSPRRIELAAGVRLEASRSPTEVFEGMQVDTLKVRSASGLPPAVEGAEPADFGFWLGELDRIYVPGAMTRAEETDAALLFRALTGALPGGPQPSAAQGENLKRLRDWIEGHPYDDKLAAARLVDESLRRLRGQALHGEDPEGRAVLRSLIGYFEALEQRVHGR